jgi:hypothetical protein
MTVRGSLWKTVKEANPDLNEEEVDALVDRALAQEWDLVVNQKLNLDQAREITRSELFPIHQGSTE